MLPVKFDDNAAEPADLEDPGDDDAFAALGMAPGLFRRAALKHRLEDSRHGGEPLRLGSPWLRWCDLLLFVLMLAALAGLFAAASQLAPPDLLGHVG